MQKSFIIAAFCFLAIANGSVLSTVSDANANVCDILTGVWTQAGLSSPSAICACFDETTSANILTLVGQVLQEGSSGSISVITKIIQQVEAFIQTIPQSDLTCLNGTAPQTEAQQIQQALGISGMSPQQIETKIASYAAFHLASLVATVKTMNTAFDNEQYSTVGSDATTLAQTIFGSGTSGLFDFLEDDNENVCEIITGVFAQAKLAEPTVVCGCLDETTSGNLLTLIGEVLQEASSGSLSVLTKIEQQVEAFVQTIPQSVITCLNSTASIAEAEQALQAYGLSGYSIQQIETKVEQYAVFHLAALINDVKTINTAFEANQFEQVGEDVGSIVQSIF